MPKYRLPARDYNRPILKTVIHQAAVFSQRLGPDVRTYQIILEMGYYDHLEGIFNCYSHLPGVFTYD